MNDTLVERITDAMILIGLFGGKAALMLAVI